MVKSGETNTAIRDLQTLLDVGAVGGLTDGELLDRFVARREPAVFEAIVRRHGPMVWGVCRRVLRDHHDAEDAFQAAFLVLSRKAASVMPRGKLGNWLYGVAYRTAVKASAMRARRIARERQVTVMPDYAESPEVLPDERLALIDHHLSRLPEKYRIPIVLCDMEGMTHQEAAVRLGWPSGTVSSRLSRARAMLARRISRPGMSLSVGSLGVLLAQEVASASMPTKLICFTAQAASLFAAGRAVTAGLVSAEVVALTGEMILMTKLRVATAILFALAVTGMAVIGSGIVTAAGAPPKAQEPSDTRPATGADDFDEGDMKRLQGTWAVTRLEQVDHRPTEDEERFWASGKHTLTIRGDRLTHDADGSFSLFKVDPTKTPKAMTLEVAEGPNKGRHVPAIYRLDGDELLICQGRLGDLLPPSKFSVEERRPKTFPTLWVLRRKAAEPSGPKAPTTEKSGAALGRMERYPVAPRPVTVAGIYRDKNDIILEERFDEAPTPDERPGPTMGRSHEQYWSFSTAVGRAFLASGKPIPVDDLWGRLSPGQVVLLAGDERAIAPHFRRVLKEDAIILVGHVAPNGNSSPQQEGQEQGRGSKGSHTEVEVNSKAPFRFLPRPERQRGATK